MLPRPERPYSALKDDLAGLGWEWHNEPQELPMIPGEPEWVEYRHPDRGRLEYEFNPALGLRSIVATAPLAVLEHLDSLPQLTSREVLAMLDSDEVDRMLLGLFGARALRLLPALPRIQALAGHPDELVSRTAADVLHTLPAAAAGEAWERFRMLREAQPGGSALVTMMSATDKRQVLRWLGADFRSATPEILQALRSGLADEDDETRVTAALVAARLGAIELTEDVKALELPDQLADPYRLAARALATGSRLEVPEPVDDAGLLVASLLQPLASVPAPPKLPRHLRREEGTVRLARSGIPVALVPSVPHWVGSSAQPANPLRRLSERPFAISIEPLDSRATRAAGIDLPREGRLELDLNGVGEVLLRLGKLEGVVLALPSPLQWEMALRGPDGRRFTSGNLRAVAAVSPWGAVALPLQEWVGGGTVRDGADPVVPVDAMPGERYAARLALAFPV